LVDFDHVSFDPSDEDGNRYKPTDTEYYYAQERVLDDLITTVCECFNAEPCIDINRKLRFSYIDIDEKRTDCKKECCFAKDIGKIDKQNNHKYITPPKFYICYDSSGGTPCIYMRPMTYEKGTSDRSMRNYSFASYKVHRQWAAGLKKLATKYQNGVFRYPDSAWTSSIYDPRIN